MKRYIISLFVFFVGILFVLSTANAEEILGCYKKNNGQLRIVSDHSECLNSENPITLGETNNQEPPPNPEPPSDNSKFYGIYSLFEKSGEGNCGHFITIAINGDQDMQSADYYLYIPPDSDWVTYSYTNYNDNAYMVVTVSVNNDANSVTMVQDIEKTNSDREWTTTRVFTFSEDYSTFTMEGLNGDDTPFECQGTISGYGQRISDIKN